MRPDQFPEPVFYGTGREAKAMVPRPKFYYTGVPCCHGHDSVRRTVNTNCEECATVRKARLRDEYAEAHVTGAPPGPMPFLHILGDWTPFVVIPPGCRWCIAGE